MSLNAKRMLSVAMIGALVAGPALAAPKKKAPAAAPAPESTVQPDAPAPAQGAQQSNKLPLIATQKDWTKVCGKDQAANKEVCYTTRDFSAEAGKPPVLALAVYDIKGDDTKIIRMLMPIGLMLRPGFRFVVDDGQPTEGAYEICFPNGCFAEAKVKTALVDTMKKGTTMNVSVRNQGNAEVVFSVPLAGFGKAFDGPAIDPKVLQEQQQKLQAGLQKQAEEQRKKLEAEKAASPTGGAAAPAPQ
jgi:invasion protein IalB